MKKIIKGLVFISALTLIGCTSTQVGTTAGGAAGAGLGYAVSGGTPLGTVIGGGAGALVGYEVGKSQEPKYYRDNGRYDYY